MDCPSCREPVEMVEDIREKTSDLIEIMYECPECQETWFGTLYRDEKKGGERQ